MSTIPVSTGRLRVVTAIIHSFRAESWRESQETASEKKYAQQFWSELFTCFGINAAGMGIFEQDAKRGSTGGAGYIDLFWFGASLVKFNP